MIEFLSTEPGVVACRLSHKITAEDTDRMTHEMELSFENDETTNFYYEMDKALEFSTAAMTHGVRQALSMLAHRKQLGRVAVVSDDPLIRGIWKVESAVLPGLTYRTFKQRQRDQALQWIEGSDAEQGNGA